MHFVEAYTDQRFPSAGPLARSAKGPSPQNETKHSRQLVVGDDSTTEI